MESGRKLPRRRKVGVLVMLVGLLTGTFSVFGPRVLADPITPGSTIGGFEIDGVDIPTPDKNDDPAATVFVPAANFTFDGTGTIDWETVPDLLGRLHFDDNHQPGDDGDDQGFEGGDKEFDPAGWSCVDDSGDDPQKDDIHYVLSYPSLSLANSTVAFGYYRDKPEGNTNVVVELNENSMDSCNGAAGRSVGDLILHFDFPGGDEAADLEAYVWNGTTMVPFDVPAGVAQAATNREDLPIPAAIQAAVSSKGLPTTAVARTFGEAAIDLEALQAALAADPDIGDEIDPDILECPGVGFANIRTRSSGSAETSQLHDLVPQIPADLSDCASLQLKKVDDLGQAMAGVQFALFASEADALAGTPIAQLPTDPPQDLVCTTDAAGICTFPKVPDGDYWINETNLPSGYAPDPDLPKAIHLDPFQDLDLSDDDNGACAIDLDAAGCEWFVNALRTGSVKITKVVVDGAGEPLTLTDTTYLDGIAFELQDGGVTVQKRGGGDAACALDLDDPADDPSCTITDVPFGTYDVVEDATTLPEGLSAGPSVSVTVDEDSPALAEVDYENPADPLNISIDKTGNTDTASVGETITYTFTVGLGDLPFDTTDDVDLQPLTSVQVSEVVLAPDYADRCTASALALTDKEDLGPLGDAWLEEGERWTYQCTHVVTAAEAFDADGTALKNRAHVTGTDRYGRTDTDTDDHLVTILLPDLEVVKLAADGVDVDGLPSSNETIDAPATATYTITVTNVGSGIARNATLTDTLPAGSWTVSLAGPDGNDVCPVGGNPESGSFTCTFGDLAAGASKTVTVSRDVASPGDCGAVLENNAGVTTTYQSVDIDPNDANDASSATINVQCADISITKVADDEVVDAGDDIGFTIDVHNAGPGEAKEVTIGDPLPAGDGVVWSVDPAVEGCAILVGTLLCDVGDLPAGGSFSVHVTGTTPGGLGNPDLPAACKVYDNTATVSAANDDDETASASTEVICPLDITIVKDGPDLAHRGDEITYTFTVTNSGAADLVDVVLTDPICDEGTLALVDDADGDTTLAVGEEWTFECTRVITATDPDPLPNTATVVGTDVRERTTDDEDDHLVDIISPAIQVVKTVDDATPAVGQTVTFTYVVTNTGDTTLFDVTVVDDQLGAIGTIDELAAGASATLTKTMVVAADSPTLNIATATGADVLGKSVTDDDPETITIVLGEVVTPTALPRTGADTRVLLLVSGLLLVAGGLLLASGEGAARGTVRRRRG